MRSAVALMLAALLPGAPLLASPPEAAPIDAQATAETRNLFRNMLRIAPHTVLFGHQNTLAYGTTWRDEDGAGPDRSDVKDVVDDFPAVYLAGDRTGRHRRERIGRACSRWPFHPAS